MQDLLDIDNLTEKLTVALAESVGPDSVYLWQELATAVPSWVASHFAAEHTIPSASTVEKCNLFLWYLEKGYPKDSDTPPAIKRRMLSGILSELAWIPVLRKADFLLEPVSPLPFRDTGIRGIPDAIANYGGERFIVEIKERQGFIYKKYLHRYATVSSIEPEIYAQMQIYIDASKTKRGLLLVCPPDYSFLQQTMRQNKAWGPDFNLPPFHLEWVDKNENHLDYLVSRIDKLKLELESDYPPHREYNGIPIGANGKKTWPCGYCSFNNTCTNQFGYGDR